MLVKYELTASSCLATVQGEGVETSSKQQVWKIEYKNKTLDWKFYFSDVILKSNHGLKEKRNLIYIFEIIQNFIIPTSRFNCPLPTDPTPPPPTHTQHTDNILDVRNYRGRNGLSQAWVAFNQSEILFPRGERGGKILVTAGVGSSGERLTEKIQIFFSQYYE